MTAHNFYSHTLTAFNYIYPSILATHNFPIFPVRGALKDLHVTFSALLSPEQENLLTVHYCNLNLSERRRGAADGLFVEPEPRERETL